MKELVTVTNDNKVVTTSKIVADYFGKNHRDVLRTIDGIVKELSVINGSRGQRNFALSSYISEQNKILKCYEMDRDAFTMLAMSFTGEKALQWKLKYIQAFNQMEHALSHPTPILPKLTVHQITLKKRKGEYIDEFFEGKDVVIATKEFIENMGRNSKATHEDHKKTLKALRRYIMKQGEGLNWMRDVSKMAMYHSALREVAEEERYRERLHHGMKDHHRNS